jgi:cytidylate kinase
MTVVAIDGPAGAGKSTVARALARHLGFRYVDTGGMYRAVALAVLEAGIDPTDPQALHALLDHTTLETEEGRVTLNRRDVSERVRAADVTAAVSRVAAEPNVRRVLVGHQRRMAEEQDVVMEGRDVGTEVFPDAEVKVFLTASLPERARRRQKQNPDAGASLGEVAAAVEARDLADQKRSVSPLVQAPDAVEIDTTGLSIDDVVGWIAALVSEAGRH